MTRPYTPDFCKASTMAALLDMSETTFRRLVDEKKLPEGVRLGDYPQAPVRWDRAAVLDAMRSINLPPKDEDDPILRGIRHGTKVVV